MVPWTQNLHATPVLPTTRISHVWLFPVKIYKNLSQPSTVVTAKSIMLLKVPIRQVYGLSFRLPPLPFPPLSAPVERCHVVLAAAMCFFGGFHRGWRGWKEHWKETWRYLAGMKTHLKTIEPILISPTSMLMLESESFSQYKLYTCCFDIKQLII